MTCPNCGEDPCGVYARCAAVTDDELIEKMARAICEECGEFWEPTLPHDIRDSFLSNARAALTALREAGYEVRAKSPT